MDGELLIKFIPSSKNKKVGVQNIKLSKGSKNIGEWQRYVILPAKKNQKYILGTNFTTQNKDNQFISIKKLLKYDETHRRQEQEIVLKGECLAGIDVCEQKKFWITPINGNTILLNEAKIEARTELKFEDYLFIEYLKVFGRKATGKITFLFLPRQTNPNAFTLSFCEAEEVKKFLNEDKRDKRKAEEWEKETITMDRFLQERVFGKKKRKNDPNLIFTQNGLIVSNILSHLSLRHVKNARFVSRLWAEEGAKQLRKRAWVHFNFENILSYPFDNDATIGMKLFRYDCDVKNSSSGFGLSNTVLSLPYYDKDPTAMNKCLMDLDWIFTQNYHRFKKIELKMNVDGKMDFENAVKLLTIISPFMEELEFSGVWKSSDEINVKFSTDDCFSKVKKVSVSGFGKKWKCFKTLISAMKMNNVKEIYLTYDSRLSSDFWDWDCLDCFNNAENFEGKQISVNLSLGMSSWDEIDSEQLGFLLSSKFDKPLKNFIIKSSLDVKSVPIFQQVLFKHCKTLEVLSFETPDFSAEWKLQFPMFEKLKVLNIDGQRRMDNNVFRGHVVKNGHFMFDDGTGNEIELDYNRHFPNLQSLTLWPWQYIEVNGGKGDTTKHWKQCYKDYKIFLPFLPSTYEEQPMQHVENNGTKLFKNLVYLDIAFDRNCLQRMEMIARNFPNVHNEWLSECLADMYSRSERRT